MKFEIIDEKPAKAIAIIHAFEDYRYGWFNWLIRLIKRSN